MSVIASRWIYILPSYKSMLRGIRAGYYILSNLLSKTFTIIPEVNQLNKREKDQTRKRRNFQRHLKFIQPQREYFEFVKENTEINVEFAPYENFEITKDKVLDIIASNQIVN